MLSVAAAARGVLLSPRSPPQLRSQISRRRIRLLSTAAAVSAGAVGGAAVNSSEKRQPQAPLLMLMSPRETNPHQSVIHLFNLQHEEEIEFKYKHYHLKLEPDRNQKTLHFHSNSNINTDGNRGGGGGGGGGGGESKYSRHLIGCSQGFLITSELKEESGFRATNPLTAASFPLRPHTYEMRPNEPYRALLSPSLSTLFLNPVVHRSDYSPPFPVFARTEDNAAASPLANEFLPYSVSSTFHRGLLHVLLDDGCLAVFDLDTCATTSPIRVLPVAPFKNRPSDPPPLPWYLVSSPSGDGDDLFLVSRTQAVPWSPTKTNLLAEEAESDFIEKMYLDGKSRTVFFKVFKLVVASNGVHYRWKRVVDIGSVALFVGHHSSYSVTVNADGSHLKPNSIYFTTWLHDVYYTSDRVGDTGVFSLEDGSIHFYQLTTNEGDYPTSSWPFPSMWYMPSRS